MEITNQPKFVIMGYHDNINQVLNRLPNKNKLHYYYLLGIDNPFIEYGFFLDREDEENNIGDFKIIVCPEDGLFNVIEFNNIILKNEYFKHTTAFIMCHKKTDELLYNTNNLLTKEIIHIWFDDKCSLNSTNNEFHYTFDSYEWIKKIYNHLDIPYTSPPNFECNIL